VIWSRVKFATAGLILFPNILPSCAIAEDYRLGVLDKVRIKVFEWRAPQEAVHEWTAMNGEFTVGASGAISLPLIGEVAAAGLKPEELANTVGERLQTRVGLIQRPSASVEIVQFRPFYILGRVDRPGEYPYRPGLTVLQAVTIAGGTPRLDPSLMRLQREAISTKGSLSVMALEANAILGRRARLETELSGQETIKFPPELVDQASDESIARIMQEEQLILKGRQESLRSQVEALTALKALLVKEIEALNAKLQLKDRQLSLTRKELDSVGALVSKGLAVVPRQFSLERAEAEIEGSRLELETALLRARQDVSRAERDILELRNKRHNEVLAELRQTQEKLEEVIRRTTTAQQLLDEADQFAAQFATERAGEEAVETHYSIVRKAKKEVIETSATDSSLVEPGDLVKVRIVKRQREERLTSQTNPQQPGGAVVSQVP
jgi:protein involved in polysaccharide export with SLBB domain